MTNCIKPIGAPWSMARWGQHREELFSLLGAHMLAVGLDPTEEQAITIVDAIMKHLYGPYPRIVDEVPAGQGLSSERVPEICRPESYPHRGNRFCAHDDCPYPDCLVGGICQYGCNAIAPRPECK